MIKKPAFFLFISAFSLTSCMSMMGIRPYVPREGTTPPAANDSVAVISGTSTEHGVLLADLVRTELANKSTLKVMDQKTCTSLIGVYPRNIRGPFKTSFPDYTKDFKNTDYAEIAKIHKKLGVKYLWVLWIPLEKRVKSYDTIRTSPGTLGTMQSIDEYVYVMGQMFMLPDNKEIAYSDLYVNCSPSAIGISMIGTSMPSNTTEGVQHLAKYIAESMMKKAGVQK